MENDTGQIQSTGSEGLIKMQPADLLKIDSLTDGWSRIIHTGKQMKK
jgi:hypothetical protein